METLAAAIASAVGGAGLASWLLKRWIEQKLAAAEAKKSADLQRRREEYALNEEYRTAVNWLWLWMVRGAQSLEASTGCKAWNGELYAAWQHLEAVNAKIKEHHRRWQAHYSER